MVARGVLYCLVPTLAGLTGCATEQAATSGPAAAAPRPRTYAIHEAKDEDDLRDGLEVRTEHGFLSQDAVEGAIHRRFGELVRCYEQAGDARDFAGGNVRLRFAVDPAGKPTDVLVLESALGSFPVERCLIDVGRTIAFPRPKGGGTTFEYSLEFRSARAVPVVDLPDADAASALPSLLAQLAADCQRLGTDALTATVYLARGTVRSVGLAAPAALDPTAARCVVDSIGRWRGPDTGRGTSVSRATFSVRDADVVAATPPPRPTRVAERTRRRR